MAQTEKIWKRGLHFRKGFVKLRRKDNFIRGGAAYEAGSCNHRKQGTVR